MAEPRPDPTASEAKALIFGTALVWGGLGIGASTLILTRGSPAGALALIVAVPGALWLYFGGIGRISRRQSHGTFGEFLRALLPSYHRRAARSLGWPGSSVVGLLGTLLATDVALALMMIATVSTWSGH